MRPPRVSRWCAGSLLRADARTSLGLRNQPPPRKTRREPLSGPYWVLLTFSRIVPCFRPPIPTPLPNISTHIVESKTIRFLLTNWMCLITTVVIIPSHFIYVVTSRVLVIFTTTSRTPTLPPLAVDTLSHSSCTSHSHR